MCELKMPHVSSGTGGDDLGSTDEVKVFKDEGEDEKRSSENLNEDKSSLIDLTESEEKASGHSYSSGKNVSRSDLSPVFGKSDPTPHSSAFNMGYLVSPYPYHNGTPPSIPVSMASKMGLPPGGPGSGLPFFCHNGDPLSQPPPAHMGIPPYQLDPKAAGEYWAPHWKRTLGPLISAGLSRPAVYPFATGQYPYPMLSPEISQVAASWHTPSVYPIGGAGSAAAAAAAAGFRSPYPSSLPITTSALPSDFYSRFSPSGLVSSQHSGLSPAIVTPGPKQELHNEINHRTSSMEHKNSSSSTNESSKTQDSGHASNNQADKKKPHIKKPLNAFMLYMKEMRAKVVAECTLKESAAINQILGRRWHALGREEQAKYYELARRERQLHMQLYPDWSSRSNTTRTKKRKRKQETIDGGNSMKKCRARYGLDQQSQWCKPCRRKKKCVRYKECGGEDGTQSEEGVGSCGSGGACEDGEDDDDEEEGSEGYSGSSPGGVPFGGSPGMPFGGSPGGPYGASSPGGLSALSSLTSPSGLLSPPSAQSLSPLTPHLVPPPPDYPPDVKPLPRPVGANPRDVNNPLSVNQLTAKCIKNSSPSPSNSKDPPPPSRTAISVP